MNFINLSTGLEFLSDVFPHSYCRLQSSHLEGKHWQRFIDSVDNHMFYLLCKGHCVTIYDCGSRRGDGMSRVIWQGIPLIRFVLENAWGLRITPLFFKRHNCTRLGEEILQSLDLRKIKYFRKHVLTDSVYLSGRWKKSEFDGKQ